MKTVMKNNMNRPLTIVILAAGLGTRLGSITKQKPKALIEVCGKPILYYALHFARRFNPTKIIIVGGHLYDQLEQAAKSIDLDVVVLKNENYAQTQRMVSLQVAREHIDGDLIVWDGDYIYHEGIASTMLPHLKGVSIFASDQQSSDPGVVLDMMVKVDEKDHLIAMSKSLTDFNYYFYSFFFCDAAHQDAYFKSADRAIQKIGADKTHLEDALLEYVASGGIVDVVNMVKPLWIEIDNPQDLKVAEAMVSHNPDGYGVV